MWFKLLLSRQHYPLAATVGKDGKLYLRLVDVGALLGRSKVYQFSKRFDPLVIQGKVVLPAHKPYPIMTQKSKLVTPDVVFNILNAKLSSLATSFAISLNAGSALVENPSNLFVESFKTSPVLHVQDSPVPNSILMRQVDTRVDLVPFFSRHTICQHWMTSFLKLYHDMHQPIGLDSHDLIRVLNTPRLE
ncbi:uncharacterized protein TNCV_3943321 [Trichonephila clavipes]|nr:uncharacterized protein TNCV_3943321 [Trichonephila clavipes]